MNNSIWKILTALGVAGIGVFFVIQVQGRLAAQKKTDPAAAAVAAAENSAAQASGTSDVTTAAAGTGTENPFSLDETATPPAATADNSQFQFELSEPAAEPTAEPAGEIRTASFESPATPAAPQAGADAAAKPADEPFFAIPEDPPGGNTIPATETPAATESPTAATGNVSAPAAPAAPATTAEFPATTSDTASPLAPAAADESGDVPTFVVPDAVPNVQPATQPAAGNAGEFNPAEPQPFERDTDTPQPENTSTPATKPTPSPAPASTPEPFPIDAPAFGNSDVPTPLDPAVPDTGKELPSLDSLPGDRDGRRIPSAGQQAQPNTPDSIRPHLSIQKQAPKTATVGVPLDYRIILQNQGDMTAYDLTIEDELGGTAELISANPPPTTSSGGVMRWSVGALAAGASREIVVRVRPTGEGTIDGTATVNFSAQVRSATVIRSPKLQLDVAGPNAVPLGSEVPVQFRITNRGSGDAANVVLRSVLPPGLRHPEGGDLEYTIDVLRAGETKSVDLTVVAAEPGERVRITAEVEADGTAPTIARAEIRIIGAQLVIERTGPEKRYVSHPARFQNIVKNETQFDAAGAYVVEQVPEGMRVESIGANGKYDSLTRQVRWDLPVIGPGRHVVLDLALVPEASGQLESKVVVVENSGFRSEAKDNTIVEVEGIHNVTADISRQDKPVAVGERFGFTVTIDNRGTAEARNVQISLQVPAEIEVLAAGTREIPGKLLPGNVVRYDKVVSIRPNEQMKFQVTLRGRQIIRNAVVQAQLKYDEMDRPLIVSESVTVYDDKL